MYTPGSGPIRIKAYGVEETLVDCFRPRRKLGMVAAGPGPAAAAGDASICESSALKTNRAAIIW